MKRAHLLIVFIILTSIILHSQINPHLEWSIHFIPPGMSFSNDSEIDLNYNLYIAGRTFNNGTGHDLTILKYTPGGELLLQFYYNSSGNNWDEAMDIEIDDQENIYTANQIITSEGTNSQAIKFSKSGDVLWKYSIPGAEVYDIELDNENNSLICAKIGNDLYSTGILTKLNNSGNEYWTFELSSDTSGFQISKIKVDNNNNNYIGISEYIPDDDVYIIYNYVAKLNAEGDLEWMIKLNEEGVYDTKIRRLDFNSDGELIVLTDMENILYKINDNGEITWRNVSSPEIVVATSFDIDSENNIVLTGYGGGTGVFDIIAKKINSEGEDIWLSNYNAPENTRDYSYDIKIDHKDNIYISGSTHDQTIFGICNVLRFSSDGQLIWAARYQAPNSRFNRGEKIFVDDSGYVYVNGEFSLDDSGNKLFLLKYSQQSGLDVKENNHIYTFNLSQNYPNPFNPQTTIEYSIPGTQFVSLNIYNSLGELVESPVSQIQHGGRHKITFDGSNYSSGVYFYRLKSGSFVETKKFVLMK